MDKPKWFNINLLATIILLVLAFVAYDLIMAFLVWLFIGLRSLVIGDNKWWTLLLFVVLLVASMKIAIAQNFVQTVVDRVSAWFKAVREKN
jgi:cell division protein FtsW (lipid II flippase)